MLYGLLVSAISSIHHHTDSIIKFKNIKFYSLLYFLTKITALIHYGSLSDILGPVSIYKQH